MTRAPQALMDSRRLLLDHLDMHPGRTVDDDLDPAEVGIVGDTAHVRQGDSYHLGLPEQTRDGYSVRESARDRAGLSDLASAVDVGEFRVTVRGKSHDLRSFSLWLVAQCKSNTVDSRDIREIIYSPDGKTVRRWDRERRRSSGDSSHLWHTHISLFRDATKAGRGLTPLFRRYLTEIGLLAAPNTTPEVPDMIRIQVRGKAPVHLSTGGGVPNRQISEQLGKLGVPLLVVETDEELRALLPPQAVAAEPIDYARLADALADALLRRVLTTGAG